MDYRRLHRHLGRLFGRPFSSLTIRSISATPSRCCSKPKATTLWMPPTGRGLEIPVVGRFTRCCHRAGPRHAGDGRLAIPRRAAEDTLHRRDIPTIVVTGVSDAKRRSEELGDLVVFTKPFHFDDLIRELRRALEQQRRAKPAVADFQQ
jgi:hypothetical protein